jgi:hypothetical protein
MKQIKLLISVILMCTVMVAFDSCKGKGDDPGPGDGDKEEAERVGKLLMAAPWKLNSLTIDGVTSSSYAGMTITFTTNGFTSTNGDPVWPASGTWTFADATAKVISRSDQTPVTIEFIDGNSMTLSLTWSKTTLGPGRAGSVGGKHVFVMGK